MKPITKVSKNLKLYNPQIGFGSIFGIIQKTDSKSEGEIGCQVIYQRY